MRIRVVKWLCIAVLFIAFVLWQWIADYEFPLRVIVCAGAIVVAVQACHSARQRWTICFLTIALLFNPAIPVFSLAKTLGLRGVAIFSLNGGEDQNIWNILK